tara:strand:- start:1863 stop:2132 length:270 start_codon:yes stop_codon:yes gene_type:complete
MGINEKRSAAVKKAMGESSGKKKGDNWIGDATKEMGEKETTGEFSAAAKKAGMSTLAYANKILSSKSATAKQKKRANFAKNAINASRKA